MNYQRSLLIDESPLQVIPALAKAIGLNEAILLQQIHYWQRVSQNEKEGVRYAAKSTPKLAETFSFWSERTIKRTIARLVDLDLVITSKKAANSWDRANWYTVNYQALNRLNAGTPASGQLGTMHGANLALSIGPKCPDGSGQLGTMIKVEKNLSTRTPYAQTAFARFWAAYPKKKSKGTAEKRFGRLKPDAILLDQILESLERAKRSADWVKEGGQFIPYPATWLHAKGWEDEIDDRRPTEPCRWPGCRHGAIGRHGKTPACEGHLQAYQRGETP